MVSQKNFLIFSVLFLIISLSLIGSINAQPPPQTNVNIDIGYDIDFPKIDILEVNQNFTFNFHVFNRSDGTRLDNSSVNCTFHLFNNVGIHIVDEMDMVFESDDGDWELIVSGGNFSDVGEYSVLINCFSVDFGGFVSFPLEVNPTENALDIQQSILILGLILILLFLTAAFLFFGNEVESLPVKIFLISVGSLFLVFTLGFSINVIKELMILGSVFSETFVNLFRLTLGLVIGGFFGILLYLITTVVKAFHKSRGIDEDD